MQFGFCSFDFPKSWLSSHFQLLSLCNLKCETSGPKGERRWNSQKEEEKVFASKYNLYYKPSGSPLLWGLSLKLVLYMNKVENQLIAIKRENTSTATEERWKVQSLSRLQKREWIRARSQTVGTMEPLCSDKLLRGEKLDITSANKGNQNRKAILWIKIDQSYEICTVWFYSFGSYMV